MNPQQGPFGSAPGGPFPPPPGVLPGQLPPGMPPYGFNPALQRPPFFQPGPMLRPQLRPPLRPPAAQPLRPPTSQPVILPSPSRVQEYAMPPKATTLYVGKIAASVEDEVMKQLLEACGKVVSWKRMADPDTGQPKGFGFCEFEDAEGVLRTLRLLSNLDLDGQELLLKCNTATQKYVDEYTIRKERQAKEGPEAMQEDGKEPGPEAESEESKDNALLEKVMAIVSERAAARPKIDAAAAAADSFLSSLREDAARSSGRGEREKSHRRGRDKERDERDLEANFQRERERERKEEEARAHEHDRAYKAMLRDWEAYESKKRGDMEKEREQEKDLARERLRQMKADLEADPSDDEDEAWRRKTYFGSRRAEERKRRREKEQHEDVADRKREAEEESAAEAAAVAAKRAKSEEGAGPRENGDHSSHTPVLPSAPSNTRLEDPNDLITQAMMNAAKAPRKAASPLLRPDSGLVISPRPLSQPRESPRAEVPKPKPRTKAVLAVFGETEEDDTPQRKLIPLTYSEEEQKAAKRAASAADKQAGKPEDAAAAIKELIKSIPTEKRAVYAYPINWDAFDQGSGPMSKKISEWVKKKTAELLGEEELSMVEFVMGQLKEHAAPQKLLGELSAVLDDEAEPFVFKLYRMVIFETQKYAQGLQDQ